MKNLLVLITIYLLASLCFGDCKQEAEIAELFMNDYAAHCNDVIDKKTKETDMDWVKRNNKVTDDFKSTYIALIKKGLEENPEGGLGFDPILDAQDYPDSGFVIYNCDEKSEYITLQGRDWTEFKVVVKIKKEKSKWLVDGAGVIKIPKEKRAKR